MTKKRSSEIFGVKTEIFSGKNVIQKSWSTRNLFSVPPQTRRQVSATGWSKAQQIYIYVSLSHNFDDSKAKVNSAKHCEDMWDTLYNVIDDDSQF